MRQFRDSSTLCNYHCYLDGFNTEMKSFSGRTKDKINTGHRTARHADAIPEQIAADVTLITIRVYGTVLHVFLVALGFVHHGACPCGRVEEIYS